MFVCVERREGGEERRGRVGEVVVFDGKSISLSQVFFSKISSYLHYLIIGSQEEKGHS